VPERGDSKIEVFLDRTSKMHFQIAETEHESDSPVTTWLRRLELGDPNAAESIFQHFFSRVQSLSRHRIPKQIQRVYDQDDATLSAFHSLFLGVSENRFRFISRHDFWRLLSTIAERKISKRIRYEHQDKRDIRRTITESMFGSNCSDVHCRDSFVQIFEGREPSSDFAADVAETFNLLLAELPDDLSREIAILKLDCYNGEEIADQIGCSRRTVQRKLLVIRTTWQHVAEIDFPE
jgi:DNA-directed RNA polymerase specialized sigma24 family protein